MSRPGTPASCQAEREWCLQGHSPRNEKALVFSGACEEAGQARTPMAPLWSGLGVEKILHALGHRREVGLEQVGHETLNAAGQAARQ